jgi:hypothetical protein
VTRWDDTDQREHPIGGVEVWLAAAAFWVVFILLALYWCGAL